MICKVAKKGLAGLALGTGLLYLAFGTSAPSYVRTAFHKARHVAQNSVPDQFQIDRAKEEIDALEPAILNNREELARAEVDVEHLQREVSAVKENLAKEKAQMVALRDRLETGDLKLAGHVNYTAEDVKSALANRMDHFRNVQRILADKESTLKARHQAVEAGRNKLTEMANAKRRLSTQLESIQARLQAIEATQVKNEHPIDDSALSHAKQTVADLEKRLEVKARVAEMEGHFSGMPLPAVDSDRDVIKEFDSEFGRDAKSITKSGDKSL
jgi:chromosome segregation ATPase